MIRVLLLVIGYCLGMIQTGYLYGRMKGIDIRKAGSGNSGATNSLRVLGKKAGLIVFAVDLYKCFIPCLIVKAWAVSSGQQHMEDIYMLYLAFGVILGHFVFLYISVLMHLYYDRAEFCSAIVAPSMVFAMMAAAITITTAFPINNLNLTGYLISQVSLVSSSSSNE